VTTQTPQAQQQPRRPVALRPAQLSGDRDWIIFVECRADTMVLYPSRREFPVASLGRGPNNPLAQAVQKMIDRRQASVRPGDPPYRPQIRFLVRPENIRTFHMGYPALDSLPVPKRRQNLEPEDDPVAIAARS
jgi:hypothetical protein